MIEGMKSNNIRVEHSLQQRLTMFQFPEDLGGRERHMDEEDHANGRRWRRASICGGILPPTLGQFLGRTGHHERPPTLRGSTASHNRPLVPRLPQHPRQERQVIIVDPNDIPPRHQLGDLLAESFIHLDVGIPPVIEPTLIPIALQLRRRSGIRRLGLRPRRTLPFLRLRGGQRAGLDGIASRGIPLPLSPPVGRQIQQIHVVKTRPQDLLAKSQIHEVQQRFVLGEKDGDAVHPLEDSLYGRALEGVLEELRGDVGDGADPGGLARGGHAVEFGFGDEALGPARVPLGRDGIAG
mmetsp:Transcript_43467/g.91313  ORF Transcript_43467/g.91313 Transcript_43467/m.91313 type:complete len:295 (-) Transcript_43467:1643-2527(-)